MKKSFFAFFCVLLSAFSFFGCKSDDDESDEIAVVLYANSGTMTNGDEGSTEKKTYRLKIGEKLRLTSEDSGLSRDGYTLKGWASSADSSEAKYYDTLEYTFSENTNLYALWKQGDNAEIFYISDSGDDTNGDGTEEKPFKTLGKAVEKLSSNYSDDKNYFFYISGAISDTVSISDGQDRLYAKSITILGKTGTGEDSVIGKDSGSIISVMTEVPVTIKKLTLTGGKGTSLADDLIGGAVYVTDKNANVSFSEVSFTKNSASLGGAVYNTNSTVNFTSCTFSQNSATKEGGAIYNKGTMTLRGGFLSENTSEKSAGAISNKTSIMLEDTRITKNTAGEYGAGICNSGTAELTRVTISENSSEWAAGIYNRGSKFSFEGGTISSNLANGCAAGIYNDSVSGTFTLSGAELSGNTLTGTEAKGAAVYNKNGTFVMKAGASIKNHNVGADGAAFYNGEGGIFTFNGGTISKNRAKKGGGVYNLGTMNLRGGTISGNYAEYGAGIYNAKKLNMTNGEISENSASIDGGGIANVGDGVSCEFSFGTISENEAKNGGGVYNDAGTFTMEEGSLGNLTGLYGKIHDNKATETGGGIYLKSGSLIVKKGIISAYGKRRVSSTSSDYYYNGNKAGENKGTSSKESYSDAGNSWYKEEAATVTIDGAKQNDSYNDEDVVVGVEDWIKISS